MARSSGSGRFFVFNVNLVDWFSARKIPVVTVEPSAEDHSLERAVVLFDFGHLGEPAIHAELGLQKSDDFELTSRHPCTSTSGGPPSPQRCRGAFLGRRWLPFLAVNKSIGWGDDGGAG